MKVLKLIRRIISEVLMWISIGFVAVGLGVGWLAYRIEEEE